MPSSYFPLDVNFFDHPKSVGLSDKAVRLYLSSIAYSNRLMTDGFIAGAIAGRLVEWDHLDPNAQTPEDCAAELVKADLWEPVDGGFEVHDFLEHNRSREERVGDREKERLRKAAYRDKQRESHQDDPDPGDGGVPPGHVQGVPEVSHRDSRARADRDRRETETTQGRSNPLSLVPSDAPVDPDPVVLVFHAWVASFPDPTRRDLTPARRDAIKAALARYPLDDVRDAVCGWRHDPWPERAQQNDLAQLLHMGSKRKPQNVLEKMRDLWRHPAPGRGTAEPAGFANLRRINAGELHP